MWVEEGRTLDDTHRYLIVVFKSRGPAAFPASWRYTVMLNTTREIIDEQICVTDADAWSEAWATVALIRATRDGKFEGAYQIGVSGY